MINFFALMATMGKLLATLWGSLTQRRAIEQGVIEQENADLRGAVQDATEANRVNAYIGLLSDDDLNQRLHDEQANRRRMFLGETD